MTREQEVENTAKALRYEGKISKETYDWFDKAYRKKTQLEEQKRRHEQNWIHSLGA